jgi:phytoene dehydrogenase-like protein
VSAGVSSFAVVPSSLSTETSEDPLATSFYDVVVLGQDLAATVAGAVLAHRGFRVLIAGVANEERYSVGPYVLPRSPFSLVGMESPALRRIVSELNLVQILRRRTEPNRPAFQLLLTNHRIDVGDELGRELARELPDAAMAFDQAAQRLGEVSAAVESILSQDLILPADGFWDRRDASRVGARLPADDDELQNPIPVGHPLRTLFAVPTQFGCDHAEPGVISLSRLGDLHRRGTYHIDGGREGLRGLLLDRLRTHSGEVRPDLTPRQIVFRRGRPSTVVFGDGNEEVGCTHVLCGMSVDRLLPLLEGEKAPRRLIEAAEMKPAFHRYHLHLVAPIDALPDVLGRLAFSVADEQQPLHGANALMLHLADGYGQHAVLSVEALAPDPSSEGLASIRREIFAHLDRLLPFTSRHLLLCHSPHDGLPPERARESTPPPVRMEPVWRWPTQLPLGFCGLPHASGLKNLYLVSRQVLPGLGLEGELQTGWGAARLVLQTEKKRDLVKGAVLEGS